MVAPTVLALSQLMAGTIRCPLSLVVGSCEEADDLSGG